MDAREQAPVEAAKKDPASFAALYEVHFERIYAFVAHRVRDRSIAEDLTAEVFRRALSSIAGFEWRGVPFKAWLSGERCRPCARGWDRVMAERDLIERLDALIDAIVAGRPAAALEPELAMFAVIASELHDLPDPRFKARLGRELIHEKEEVMKAVATVTGVRPYFIVRGADDLIAFLQQTFDAEVMMRVPTPEGSVMHAEVRVGDSFVEVGDAGGQWEPIAAPQHVYIDDVDEVYRRAIAAGAKSLYEPTNQSYGDREAGVVDQRGIQWFLATHLEGGSPPPGFGTVTTGFRASGAKRMVEFLEKAFGAVHVSGGMEHAEIRLGETMIELSEAHGEWGPTRGAFHLFVSDCDGVYAEALRAGATSLYEPVDKPYGERSGGVTDPWGNQWYIATPL